MRKHDPAGGHGPGEHHDPGEVKELPADLLEIEATLAARRRPAPPAGLRGRILGAVRQELRRHEQPAPERRSTWSFAAGVAAAALIWLNLSLFAANDTDFIGYGRAEPGAVAEAAGKLRRVLPELSQEQASRHALLLVLSGRVRASPGPVFLRRPDPPILNF